MQVSGEYSRLLALNYTCLTNCYTMIKLLQNKRVVKHIWLIQTRLNRLYIKSCKGFSCWFSELVVSVLISPQVSWLHNADRGQGYLVSHVYIVYILVEVEQWALHLYGNNLSLHTIYHKLQITLVWMRWMVWPDDCNYTKQEINRIIINISSMHQWLNCVWLLGEVDLQPEPRTT